MTPDKLFEIGAMLGLEREDIQNVLSDKSDIDTTNHLEVPASPVDTYDKQTYYGTISINDF